MKLFSVNQDAKTKKGVKYGYLTGALYLAPHKESGVMNTCPNASEGCKAVCLFTAGRAMVFPKVNQARIARTKLFKSDNKLFMELLCKDIEALERKAKRENLIPCIRLNATSDIPWENTGIMQKFPHITFYDYSKSIKRALDYAAGKLPKNYHITFSRAESNGIQTHEALKANVNVAMVFDKVPDTYKGKTVVNGDLSDLRFLDPPNSIIGLKAKGKARNDTSGFVIHS
jgi:hypothetical protein